MEMGDRIFHHAFDGFAKLTSFAFNGSNIVNFSTKFIQSKGFTESKKENTIAPFILFDRPEPPFTLAEKARQLYNGIDNTNVNIHAFPKDTNSSDVEFLAVSDFWQSYQIDGESLDTISHVNPELPTYYMLKDHVPLPSTSHPVQEKDKNTFVSFVSYMSPVSFLSNYINVIRIKTASERENIVSIKRKKLSYMHAMGLSENYAIIFADPLYINQWKILENVQPVESLEWFPSEKTDILVVNLETKEVTEIPVEAKVHMHFVNAFEKNGKIIIDYITYPNFNFIRDLTMHALNNITNRNKIDPASRLVRYKINPKRKTVKVNNFTRRKKRQFVNNMDFPTINEEYRHKKHCYIYGVVLKSDNVHLATMSLVKKDLCNGTDKHWSREDHFATEPTFVANPNATSEDDGVLLTVVLNGKKKKSYLAVFDGKTLKMIAKGYLSDHIPFTLHGNFFNL